MPSQRTSLKERVGVKRVSAGSFAAAEPFAGHDELTPRFPAMPEARKSGLNIAKPAQAQADGVRMLTAGKAAERAAMQ